MAFGAFIAVGYNLGLWRDRFHSDFWFAFAWGAFPALTSYWINAQRLDGPSMLLASALLYPEPRPALAQHPGEDGARRALAVEGAMDMVGGEVRRIDRSSLIEAPERALRLMSLAIVVLAGGLLASRL